LSTKEGQKKQSEKRVVTKNTPKLGIDSESQSTKTRLRGYDGVERISDITKAISNDVNTLVRLTNHCLKQFLRCMTRCYCQRLIRVMITLP
jgi:hypothetical protein